MTQMTHIRKITSNGRRFSVCLDSDQTPSYFVHLTSKSAQDKELQQLVAKSWDGFKSGYSPSLCESGVGGTYFLRDQQNHTIGVFKPHDEEMGMLNNPKGFTPDTPNSKEDSARRGVMGGEAAFREAAAYILDRNHFSGVPATDIVMCTHPFFKNSPDANSSSLEDRVKLGSFQEFKQHDFDTEDISPKEASKFPVHEVHKISILDIRMFNTDRHGGNILVRKIKEQRPSPPSASASASSASSSSVRPTPSVAAYRPPFLRRYEALPTSPSPSPLTSAAQTPPDLVGDDDDDDYDSSSSMEDSPTLASPGRYSPNGADEIFDMELDESDSKTFDKKEHIRSPFPNYQPLPSSFAKQEFPKKPQLPAPSLSPLLYSNKNTTSTATTIITESYELIPIDHGYTLPHTLCLADCWFEWLNWPQAKSPFSESDLLYIKQLDGESDAQLLRSRLGDVISSDSLKILRICTKWLQIGAKNGLTPYEIGGAMCRRNVEVPSELETMNEEALLYVASANLTSSLMSSSSSFPSLSSSSDSVYSTSPQDALFFEKLEEIMQDRAQQKKSMNKANK